MARAARHHRAAPSPSSAKTPAPPLPTPPSPESAVPSFGAGRVSRWRADAAVSTHRRSSAPAAPHPTRQNVTAVCATPVRSGIRGCRGYARRANQPPAATDQNCAPRRRGSVCAAGPAGSRQNVGAGGPAADNGGDPPDRSNFLASVNSRRDAAA